MSTEESGRPSRWERVERIVVYNSPRRARYPSAVRCGDGALLVLFTRQTALQEEVGRGDLLLARSSDKGRSWSEPDMVFEGQVGQPRAIGSMTALGSGRIVAPFAELGDDPVKSRVRLLVSDDDGGNWAVEDMEVAGPLAWWAPSGRVIEALDGSWVMPVYGAVSQEDLRATIQGCGLLRSADGGRTWGDFSWIARGPRAIIGAAPDSRFSFEGPSVQPLSDRRWLAMVTARRLNRTGNGPTEINEGPGAPLVLCRLWSCDEGRTWTDPDQLMPGAWSDVTAVRGHVLCANTLWCSWGEMRLEVSRDGFASIFQELPMLSRGWTLGRTNVSEEAPLPPTVPFLSEDWPFEHYGYPSLLPLDEDEIVAVFGRTQWGTPSYHDFDPPELDEVPLEMERIQAVFYRRRDLEEGAAGPPAIARPSSRGRWVLMERIVVPDLGGAMAQEPNGDLIGIVDGELHRSSDGGRTWRRIEGAHLPGDGSPVGALGVLSTGRWLAATQVYGGFGNDPKDWGATVQAGMRGGYPLRRHSGVRYDYSIVVSCSDDEGRTWCFGEPFKGPFLWAIPSVSHFIESPDGVIGLPVFGCVTAEEMDSYSASNGVIRSHDRGKTWGDFSFIFRTNVRGPDDLHPEPRYSEMDIAQLPNGHWVAYSRHERIGGGPQGMGATEVAVSTDLGRRWTRTGGRLQGVSQQKGVVLPDGGIALTYRTHSWQAPGVAITYDEGRSFSYLLTGPYETVNAFVCGEDEFVIFTARSARSDMCAGVYRWVAFGDAQRPDDK